MPLSFYIHTHTREFIPHSCPHRVHLNMYLHQIFSTTYSIFEATAIKEVVF